MAIVASLGSAPGWPAPAALALLVAAIRLLPSPRADPALARLLAGGGGALLVNVALRLEWDRPAGVSAVAAVLVLAPPAISGLRRLEPPTRRRLRSAGRAVTGIAGAAFLLGLVSAVQALPSMRSGLWESRQAVAAAGRGDAGEAAQGLATASHRLFTAHHTLSRWWARPALALPLVGPQLRALRTLAGTGAELAATGAAVVEEVDVGAIRLTNGTVPVDRISELQAPLRRSLHQLDQARTELGAARSPWLVPPLASRLRELRGRVDSSRNEAEVLELASGTAPALMGADGPRRYFLAMQNPAELRATGGIIGNFGEITVVDGRLQLTRVGRALDLNLGGDPTSRRLDAPPDYRNRYRSFHPERVWQNVNASPDFPTVARVIAGLYPQSGGKPVDGVISVDPAGLAALLQAVGPVEVPGWPEPISTANAERILLHDQYTRYPTSDRIDFLADTTRAIWSRLTTGTLPDVATLAAALGPAGGDRHLLMWSPEEKEQRLFERLGVAGDVPAVTADSLGVITQNAGGNKIDWFLQRSIDYRAHVEPSTGQVSATLDIRLDNHAPGAGLPPLVIAASGRARTRPGENLLYLSVYTPWSMGGAEVDGRPLPLESQLELGRRVYSTYLTVAPGGTRHVRLQLSGRLPPGQPYALEVLRQVTIRPDSVTTSVTSG